LIRLDKNTRGSITLELYL